ncbi:hypothetical protein [Endothiovibrio diazotrophicus]
MNRKPYRLPLLVLALLIAGGSHAEGATGTAATETSAPIACHVIYDAGSSGTRLYLYEQRAEGWLEHEGPKVSALADPVREIRGKRWQDAEAVTDEVVAALDGIVKDGPPGKEGRPAWQGFDWPARCDLLSASVYATAGMRIAEYENRARSEALWRTLRKKLAAKVGRSVALNTRTLSGYEEGLYAWLSAWKQTGDERIGIVEMGGASAQITFPCPDCDITRDAVKSVVVDGRPIRLYSYSFLGLGQDEAPKSLGLPQACDYGVGHATPGWKESDCASQITITGKAGIIDPYNYDGAGRGTHNRLPAHRDAVDRWFLTGAFNYMKASDVQTCCVDRGNCYGGENACFQAVYLKKYLRELEIPPQSAKLDVSWTLGAAVCQATGCLRRAITPVCRWSREGCL